MHLSGCIEQIGMHKKFSQVSSVGKKNQLPLVLVYPMVFCLNF